MEFSAVAFDAAKIYNLSPYRHDFVDDRAALDAVVCQGCVVDVVVYSVMLVRS